MVLVLRRGQELLWEIGEKVEIEEKGAGFEPGGMGPSGQTLYSDSEGPVCEIVSS